MSTSIQFNGTEINNVTYITENTTHDEAPSRSISAFKIARRDGEKLVSAFWGRKEITITGYIIGSNRADFENQVDLLKSLLSPQSANLDINYNGVYRRYIATAEEIKINRDSFNIDWAPYSAKFLVPLGIGADTSENNISSVASIVSTPYSVTKTFGGSYNPKPRHRVTLVTRGNADVIRIKNTVTLDYIDVDLNGVVDNYYIDINEDNQMVLLNGVTPINWRGKFPSVSVGSNTLELTIIGPGSTLDTSIAFDGTTDAKFVNSGYNSAPRGAQSFVPVQSGRIYKISPSLRRVQNGGLGGQLYFYIVSDNNGIPGTVGTTSQFVTNYSAVPDSIESYVDAIFSDTDINRPYVIAGTRYWVYLIPTHITGGSPSNWFAWGANADPNSYLYGKSVFQKTAFTPYLDGYADASLTAGGTLGQYDMAMNIYRGGNGGAANYSINWDIYYTRKYL